MTKLMAEEDNEHYAMGYHFLESDFSSTEVHITSVDRSPRLAQWASEDVHLWPEASNTQTQLPRIWRGRIEEEVRE